MASYTLKLENDRLMEVSEFVEFCHANQGRSVTVRVNNEGHCLDFCGVYRILDLFEFESVEILTCNAVESHPRYTILNQGWHNWLARIGDFDFEFDRSWSGSKRFGIVYGRPSAPRLGIALHLLQHHRDQTTLITQFNFSSEDARRLVDISRLFEWDPEKILHVDTLTMDPRYRYEKGRYEQANNLSHAYREFLIDIVSEPTCHGRAFYPTEKIVRAMLCRRPFIVMASQNYLAYLRQIGFQTFNELWDEDYDGVDSNLRYRKILELIDCLGTMTDLEITNMYKKMHAILQHNFNVLTDQTYRRTVTVIT